MCSPSSRLDKASSILLSANKSIQKGLIFHPAADKVDRPGMKSRSILKHMNNEMNGHKVYSVFHLCLGLVFLDKLNKWAIQYNPADRIGCQNCIASTGCTRRSPNRNSPGEYPTEAHADSRLDTSSPNTMFSANFDSAADSKTELNETTSLSFNSEAFTMSSALIVLSADLLREPTNRGLTSIALKSFTDLLRLKSAKKLMSTLLKNLTDLLHELMRCHRSKINEFCTRAFHGSAPGTTMMATDEGLTSSALVLFADLLRECRLTPANSGLTSTLLEYLTDLLHEFG
nr:hypothetical protein Iba_chr12eCG2120 [Ipomoea batatas]